MKHKYHCDYTRTKFWDKQRRACYRFHDENLNHENAVAQNEFEVNTNNLLQNRKSYFNDDDYNVSKGHLPYEVTRHGSKCHYHIRPINIVQTYDDSVKGEKPSFKSEYNEENYDTEYQNYFPNDRNETYSYPEKVIYKEDCLGSLHYLKRTDFPWGRRPITLIEDIVRDDHDGSPNIVRGPYRYVYGNIIFNCQ